MQPLEIVGGMLALVGLLGFFLIDADEGSWGPECRQADCPPVQWWQRPVTVEALLVILGFFGVALMMWGFLKRELDDSP